jgi:hypothetical protein
LPKTSIILLSLIFYLSITYTQTDSVFYTLTFGDFSDAASISTSRGEFIYVSDLGTNKIYKFDITGKQLFSYGGTGLGKYELNQPVSIDASNGLDVFVSDMLNNRIIRLDNKLNLISLFEFNVFNTHIENSKKIFNPESIAIITTGEMFVICDAGNYKIARINNFNDVDLYFGQSQDRIINPLKIVKGNTLDVWILDKGSNELLNFNNLGIFVKRIKLPEQSAPVGFTYIDKNLVIIYKGSVYYYDLDAAKFSDVFFIPAISNIKDISFIDDDTFVVLSSKRVYFFKLNK